MSNTEFHFRSIYPGTYGFEENPDFAIQVYLNGLLYGIHPNNWKISKNPFFQHAYLAMIWNVIGGNESEAPGGIEKTKGKYNFHDVGITLGERS
ncbi:hypothetical protein NEOLI_004159 [Neolecta irregularis DAH-3]|uniref:Uncharacterized protein n=1 Tax=Neolecta irregularis (strain DAH-3) TaxID=1198029 RepID=A0A1U7LNZ3_NEOID|nr:hypothetical protein NEOLI_004159 [Neolecta irregularis DAH-3]|eukprot:OLL24375.1 hypothetical protein NEOLI_004159 [Neolecta irregularis DAH-3]